LLTVTVMVCVAALGTAARADLVVDYTVDVGGNYPNEIHGVSARATYKIVGTELTILLENTSTVVPMDFDDTDALLVSLGLNLPVNIAGGDLAVIGEGSCGLGTWSSLREGDSVAEEWLWTNDGGGDLMERFSHVISTSNEQGNGTQTLFGGGLGDVGGPYGGIVRPDGTIKPSGRAVKSSIFFTLTLADSLTELQLAAAVRNSMIEFGSDQKYICPVPTAIPGPGAALLGMLALPMIAATRRRSS